MADEPRPLEPLVGNGWVPNWALRPGSYRALETLTAEMPVWLLLHSRNGDYWHPSYHTREQIGVTLGIGRATVSRRLKALRKAALLFEVDRGTDSKTRRHRAVARWALDPFTAEMWRPKVAEALTRIAEQDGHDGRWFQRAITSLDAFERRSAGLRVAIADDLPFVPKKRKKHRKRKNDPSPVVSPSTAETCDGPGSNMSPRPDLSHEGIFISTHPNGNESTPSTREARAVAEGESGANEKALQKNGRASLEHHNPSPDATANGPGACVGPRLKSDRGSDAERLPA